MRRGTRRRRRDGRAPRRVRPEAAPDGCARSSRPSVPRWRGVVFRPRRRSASWSSWRPTCSPTATTSSPSSCVTARRATTNGSAPRCAPSTTTGGAGPSTPRRSASTTSPSGRASTASPPGSTTSGPGGRRGRTWRPSSRSGPRCSPRAARRAAGADRAALQAVVDLLAPPVALDAEADPELLSCLEAGGTLAAPGGSPPGPVLAAELVTGPALAGLVARYRVLRGVAGSPVLSVRVDPARARFSTWYELFPRSASPDPGRHGHLRRRRAAASTTSPRLGFDVLYLPPIHPIGRDQPQGPRRRADRRARTTRAARGRSARAEGGPHRRPPRARHPRRLRPPGRRRRPSRGIDVALDLAFQCSPDHPWVREHPEWFRHRPDGTIRYAENPPKRYEDIYPLDFETAGLAGALGGAARRSSGSGSTRASRSSGSTTRTPSRFALLGVADRRACKAEHPEVIFLSEAFTRPKVMHRLAKVGFTQSYTYFTWRNAKWELEQYLDRADARPERRRLLPAQPLAQHARHPDRGSSRRGGRAAFVVRLVLAGTLAASYGIYGPAFELQEHVAAGSRAPRSTSTRRSTRSGTGTSTDPTAWPRSIARREPRSAADHPALQHDRTLRFHRVDNDQLLAYSKTLPGSATGRRPADAVVVVVNLDPDHTQSGWVDLDLADARPRPSAALRCARPAHRRPLPLGAAPATSSCSTRRGCPPTSSRSTRRARRPARRAVTASRRAAIGDGPGAIRRPGGRGLVQGRRHLRAARPRLPRHRRRRDRRLPGPASRSSTTSRSSGSPRSGCCPSTRRRCATTATTSPTTAGSTRPTARSRDFRPFLREAHRRGHAGHHRAGARPHLRRAPLVPAGPAAPRRDRLHRDFYVWSDTPDRFTRGPGHLQGLRDAPTGPATRSPRPTTGTASTPTSRASTTTTRRCARPCSTSSTSGSRWASTACASTPCPTSTPARAPTCENLPETFEFLRELRAHVDERFADRMLLAEANQWPEDAVAYMGDGDDVPHGVPLPADAAACSWPPARRTASRSSTSWPRPRRPRRTASGRCSSATTTS